MTKIIGILKLTLDSFSDGGMYYDLDSAKKHVSDMVKKNTKHKVLIAKDLMTIDLKEDIYIYKQKNL